MKVADIPEEKHLDGFAIKEQYSALINFPA
jgi:hypothetical protein